MDLHLFSRSERIGFERTKEWLVFQLSLALSGLSL